jgi:hypothetical protein
MATSEEMAIREPNIGVGNFMTTWRLEESRAFVGCWIASGFTVECPQMNREGDERLPGLSLAAEGNVPGGLHGLSADLHHAHFGGRRSTGWLGDRRFQT